MTDYPTSFYIAHRLFRSLSGQPWGCILDGPETDEEFAITKILYAFQDDLDMMEYGDLRVWHIADGKAEDVTDWAIAACKEQWAATYEDHPWVAA